MLAKLQRYIDVGCPVGGFLRAVISNDLREAVGRADERNISNLPAYVVWLYNEAPSGASGSPEAYQLWLGHRGMRHESL